MIKPLIKKQLLEVFSWIFVDRKNGNTRSGKNLVIYIALYLFLFGYMGVMFYMLADFLCEPLVNANLGWFYFVLMSFMGIVAGVVGSVFTTFASLYKAKDNDLIFSLPISQGKILFSRLIGVWSVGFLYELLVMVPSLAVWYINNKSLTVLGYIQSALIPFILSLFILSLACVLGYVVAIISSKLKHKNAVTVVLSLGFIVVYYYFYSKAYDMLQELIENPEIIDGGVKNAIYPFYQMGLAADGEVLPMVIFTAIVAALFFIVYFILSSNFIKIATTEKGQNKVKYKGNVAKSGNLKTALLRKEFKRFLSSPTYMLNCGLGTILFPVVAVFMVVKRDMFSDLFAIFGLQSKEMMWLCVAAMMTLLGSMCDYTAPSVSLEGKHIWIIKTLPVPALAVLMAKIKVHLILSVIPSVIFAVTAAVITEMTVLFAVLTVLTAIIFSVFSAFFGILANLLFPNLNWTNEVVPIKQSMSTVISIFGTWIITLIFGVLYYYVFKDILAPAVYLALSLAVMVAATVVIFAWVKTKGVKKFESL